MFGIIFCGTEDHNRLGATVFAPQRTQELDTVHDRHVPVEKDHVRHLFAAIFKGLDAIASFEDLETEILNDAASNFPDDTRVVDDQT